MLILKTTMKERIIFMSVKEDFFSGILVEIRFRNNLSSGMEKFLSRCPTLWCAILLARPIMHAKYEWSKRKRRCRNIDLCSLLPNRTCSFHFKYFSVKRFCNEAFVV